MMGTTTAARVGNQKGFTLIDMLFVIALIGVLSTLAIPGLMRARGAAQSSSALGTIRVVNSAQLSFAITCGLGFYSPDFPTLARRPPSSRSVPRGRTGVGSDIHQVRLQLQPRRNGPAGAPATCNGLGAGLAAPGYAVVADQLDAPPIGGKFYGSNADGVIYQHTASLALIMPESGGPSSGVRSSDPGSRRTGEPVNR